jgi:hypothetical protein
MEDLGIDSLSTLKLKLIDDKRAERAQLETRFYDVYFTAITEEMLEIEKKRQVVSLRELRESVKKISSERLWEYLLADDFLFFYLSSKTNSYYDNIEASRLLFNVFLAYGFRKSDYIYHSVLAMVEALLVDNMNFDDYPYMTFYKDFLDFLFEKLFLLDKF